MLSAKTDSVSKLNILANAARGRPVVRTRDSLISSRPPIGVDIFQIHERTRRRAVLFLHGANGLHRWYYRFANTLAQSGFVTFLPHLFERTGTLEAWSDKNIARANFSDWLKVASDALGCIAGYPGINCARIGVVGVSLGGTLGLSLGSCSRNVKAVASISGEMPDFFATRACSMPPTILMHGALDTRLPIIPVQRWVSSMKVRGLPCELRVYPGERHVFSRTAGEDAIWRTIEFFNRCI
jgi:dipeptidyl aminopeptidase/acylaminoacyl peptidase